VLDRFLFSSVVYPTDNGFIPDTLAQDGDPLDAMVCVSEPTFPGCMIDVKPIALFRMEDDKGIDDKVLCVPLSDPGWNTMEKLEDLSKQLRRRDRPLLLDLQGPRAEGGAGRRLVPARGRAEGDRALAPALPRGEGQTANSATGARG
jgi:Inorganic pyrophosphatase